MQNAIDSKVDGIAVTLAQVDAVARRAEGLEAGEIPVVAFNYGIDQYKHLGAQMYFGSDEHRRPGRWARKISGLRCQASPLCGIIQEQGSVALEARCAGVKANARLERKTCRWTAKTFLR